jgi:hypothetical protein
MAQHSCRKPVVQAASIERHGRDRDEVIAAPQDAARRANVRARFGAERFEPDAQ